MSSEWVYVKQLQHMCMHAIVKISTLETKMFLLKLIKPIKKFVLFFPLREANISKRIRVHATNVKCRCRVLQKCFVDEKKNVIRFQIIVVMPQLFQFKTDHFNFYDQSLWCTIKNRYDKTKFEYRLAKSIWFVQTNTNELHSWIETMEHCIDDGFGWPTWKLCLNGAKQTPAKWNDEWVTRERE